MLAAELVISIVATFVGPGLNTSTMLQIVLPFSFVHSAIYMLVNPCAIRFVVSPVTIVNVSINVDKLAFSMSTIFSPLSHVLSSIRPGLLAETITETSFPLTIVHGTSFKLVSRSLLSWLIGFINAFRHSLSCFFLGEVFRRAHLL